MSSGTICLSASGARRSRGARPAARRTCRSASSRVSEIVSTAMFRGMSSRSVMVWRSCGSVSSSEMNYMRPKNGCTCTIAPASVLVPCSGSTMKQLASLMVCSRPEPVLPVWRTMQFAAVVAAQDCAVVLDPSGLLAQGVHASASSVGTGRPRLAGEQPQRRHARTGRTSPSRRPDCRAGRRTSRRSAAEGERPPGRMAMRQNPTWPSSPSTSRI